MSSTVTSIRIDDELLKEAKEYASFEGKTLGEWVCDILSEKLQDDKDYKEAIHRLRTSESVVSMEEMMSKYGM